MNRKNMPLILMLVAGAVTCVITFVRDFSILGKLTSLFIVLLIFYILGSILRFTLDTFDMQNEEKNKQEGEVIEKENEDGEDTEEKEQEVREDRQ